MYPFDGKDALIVSANNSSVSIGMKQNQVSRPPHIGSLPSSYNQVTIDNGDILDYITEFTFRP